MYLVRKIWVTVLSLATFKQNTLNWYVKSKPSPKNAVDIFKGEWASRLPAPYSGIPAGSANLFDDERIAWFVEQVGGVAGCSALELGPLEGGHSYMLEKQGAASVLAIEANTHAYLKCLVIKDLLELERVRFLCGDFMAYLNDDDGKRFDVCVASGVLYHMQNPAELIGLLAKRCTSHLFLWTHYYDEATISASARLASKFARGTAVEHAGFRHTLYRQEYGATTFHSGFCGGTAPTSSWMSRQDILDCLTFFGFSRLNVAFDQRDHVNGPAFAVAASRS
jgi:hypothetical protein